MMSKTCFILCAFTLLGALICCSAKAGLVINEVLANEPIGYVTLEWIEIYNDSSTAVSVVSYQLKVGDKWIALPDDVWLDAGEYYIICRKLVSDASSPGFEGLWGDSSGVWGDTPEENRLQTPFTAKIVLANKNGTVELYNPSGLLISELTWSEPGEDGFSWERVSPQSLGIVQSVDPNGSTPGFINSHTPVSNDLALEEISVTPDNGETSITFVVTNRGLNTVWNALLILSRDLGDNAGGFVDTIDAIDVTEIKPGSTFVKARRYFFDGVYVNLRASLSDDDRTRNNRLDFIATGADFPPIILSELLANPEEPLETEWVEIKNRLNQPLDIIGWQLGDSLVLHTISDTPVIIDPNEYAVLAKDSPAFLDFYHHFNKRCLQPDLWPLLNNDHDVIRLVDSFRFEADRFTYTRVFNDNYTWSRGEEAGYENDWGRSERVGGSPGEPNSVLYEPTGSDIAVTIEPNVFSPDGDGSEDVVVITVEEAPAESEVVMKIYDRQGRTVRTLIDSETLLRTSYTWDGRSDGGRRLPIGIYILYLEAAGSKSVKKPIVIAR
jgi:hypothetical protein